MDKGTLVVAVSQDVLVKPLKLRFCSESILKFEDIHFNKLFSYNRYSKLVTEHRSVHRLSDDFNICFLHTHCLNGICNYLRSCEITVGLSSIRMQL